MGDSGDQGQDTDEFTSDAELDQIAADAQAIQDARDSGSEDTTDSLTIADLNTIADRAGVQGQVDDFQQMQDQTNQEKVAKQQAFAQNMANMARQSLQDTIEEERGMAGDLTLADLTPNVTATVPTTFTQGSIFDVDDFSKATDDRTITQRGDIQKQTLENLLNVTPNVKNMMRGQTDASDFNIAGSKAAADLRERAKGTLSPTMQGMLPFGNLLNTLTGLPAQRTLDALNRGEVPDFQNMKDGQIQGTTGKGFGADQTEGYIGGLSINAPGAPSGLNTLPTPNFVEPEETTDDGGETVKKAPPKAPTDPCPEGYQLIDGKCTLMEKPVDEGTGFIRFPTDRTPPFQTGPFTPKTVATDPKNITPLNPVTFRLSDIFKT
tara:strand:+ start:149 stop:1285 length:1137 start_codon:yes stop_codon:yes gene_type:complete